MVFIFFIVSIKHAINLINIELIPISAALITDVIFIFSMLIFILIVTMLIFYLPMMLVIQFDLKLNTFFPQVVHGRSLLKPFHKSVFTLKEPIFLQFCVIRC